MKLRGTSVVLVTFGALVALSLSPASSGSGTQTLSALRVGLPGAVTTLDAFRSSTAVYITDLALETLMKIGPDGQVRPFWDGSELTADDVANSLNYFRYPGSQMATFYPPIKSIVPVNRYTVAVTLKRPDATWNFISAMYPTQIFKKTFQDAHKTTYGQPGVLTMGTGPFKIDSLNPTSGAELSANPRWWGGAVPLKRLSLKWFADDTSRALALRGGAIDLAPEVGNGQAFAATSGAKVISAPGCGLGVFSMPTAAAPWNDIHVRRAVAYALNRGDIVKAAGGFATPVTTMIPPSQLRGIASQGQITALLKSLPQYPFNLAKAKAEMAQSAYPNGFKATLPEFAYLGNINAGQAIAAQLKQIGINAQVTELPGFGAWAGAVLAAPDKRQATFFTNGCYSPDPNWYSYLLGSAAGFNTASYKGAGVDDLLDQGKSTSVPAKRFAVYSKLLQRLATDVPYIPLFVQNDLLGLSSKVTWPGFNNFWINGPWALDVKSA
jgi:peptide/nickel transport system substrate-binding protein